MSRCPARSPPRGQTTPPKWSQNYLLKSAGEQAAALAGRDPAAIVSLDDPGAVAKLMKALPRAGAGEQATALATRAAAHAPLDNPYAIEELMNALRVAGMGKQPSALIGRLPAEGFFELFRKEDSQGRYNFGHEPNREGKPASAWSWSDLD